MGMLRVCDRCPEGQNVIKEGTDYVPLFGKNENGEDREIDLCILDWHEFEAWMQQRKQTAVNVATAKATEELTPQPGQVQQPTQPAVEQPQQ